MYDLSQVDTESCKVVKKRWVLRRGTIAPAAREDSREISEGMVACTMVGTGGRKSKDYQTEEGDKKNMSQWVASRLTIHCFLAQSQG